MTGIYGEGKVSILKGLQGILYAFPRRMIIIIIIIQVCAALRKMSSVLRLGVYRERIEKYGRPGTGGAALASIGANEEMLSVTLERQVIIIIIITVIIIIIVIFRRGSILVSGSAAVAPSPASSSWKSSRTRSRPWTAGSAPTTGCSASTART